MNRRTEIVAVVPFLTIAFFAVAAPRAVSQDQLCVLEARDGTISDRFGISVAVSDDRAVVGADSDSQGGLCSGSACIFDSLTGQQLFKLVPSDPYSWMMFGSSVAIDGNRVAVGASSIVATQPNGATYLFDTYSGQQILKLVPADSSPGDWFGSSVSISGDIVVVGAPGKWDNGVRSGAVYVFQASTGQELLKLLPADGQTGCQFGCSVALSGDRAVIGSCYHDTGVYNSGAAYVFDLTNGNQLFKLVPADRDVQDLFGWSVALDGNLALIGAHQDDDLWPDSGSAYVFDVTTGQELRKLLPTPGYASQQFGFAVALRDGIALVGAPSSQVGSVITGCGFSFDVESGVQHGPLIAAGSAAGDGIGSAVGLSASRAILGAPFLEGLRGGAFVFTPTPAFMGYCFGDPGSGTPCPCVNDNDGSVPGSGCANGAFASGARLTARGTARVGLDDLVLVTTGLDPNNMGLYFQANNRLNDGDGVVFGDGLRCAGGGLIRLQVCSSNSQGVSSTSVRIAAKGSVAPGDRKRYQYWYHDNSGGQPCGVGVYDFNLSNGLEVTWRP